MSAPAVPTRDELERLPSELLRPASGVKPSVARVETAAGPIVVKDVRPARGARRTLARWLLGRERRALERVAGLEGCPRLLGRIDRDALAMSWVAGRPLDEELFRGRPRAFVSELLALIDALHARGVYHLDLHQRRNLLVDPKGRLHVVDFGAALVPGRMLRALLGPLLRHVDRQAPYKHLAHFAPEELTVEEARAVLRQRRLRRLWPFTRSGPAVALAARARLASPSRSARRRAPQPP
jgi:predicted Ser/Thr protein kinase